MNILFLSIDVPTGNKRDKIAYNFVVKEMKVLAGQGYNIYFLSGTLSKDEIIDNVKYISKDSILEQNKVLRRIKNLFFLTRHITFFLRFCFISFRKTMNICSDERAIHKIISKFHIDLIHTHFFHPSGENALFSSIKYKIPIIATLRGAELMNRHDLDYGAMLDSYFKTMAMRTLKYVSFFTVPNKFLYKQLINDFNILPDKIKYLPNGVHINKCVSVESTKDDKIKFIAVGGLIKRKNYDILLSVFKCLQKDNLRLTIVGSGPLYGYLESIIKKECLTNVLIIDEMPKDKLFELISNSDCLLHPSFIEGMPNVVMESLVLGIPCIASNIPGNQELIIDDFNGWLFNPSDTDELVSKIKHYINYINNKENILLLRENCINSIRNFSIQSKIKGYSRIYELVKNV